MRIVVLDDQRSICEVLQLGLELDGHTVDIYDIPSAFLVTLTASATTSEPFDLLIVDLCLSEGMSGVEVIHQVWDAFPNLPVILISAASSWLIEPARRALPGVRVLAKPFSIRSLLALMKEFAR
jgi:two-component system, cell cycle response regulator CpdR